MGSGPSAVVEYWFDKSKTDPLPRRVDLRNTYCFPYPETKDQGTEGSCVSYALVTAYVCAQRRKNVSLLEAKVPSIQEHFHTARQKSQVRRPITEGLTFSEAMKAMDKDTTWYRLGKDLVNFKRCLRSGFPIVVGFVVTKRMRQWQETQTEIEKCEFTFPPYREKDNVDGFHTTLFVGYDDDFRSSYMRKSDLGAGVFIVRNSWGKDWGHHGHFFIPYDTIRQKDFVKDAMVIDVEFP
jgi:hypothetical protein